MKKYNPISKTYYQYENGKTQHYSEWLYTCNACGHAYLPRVLSQSNLIRLAAIVVGFAVFALIIIFFQKQLYLLFIAMAAYATLYCFFKKRKEWKKGETRAPKYGELIIECPKCGSAEAEKKSVYRPIK